MQLHDARYVVLDLLEHFRCVVLLGIVLEHDHAVFLVDCGENLARFDLRNVQYRRNVFSVI